jgi:hypothetical protein
VDISGVFDINDYSGLAHEAGTNCKYVIDPASGPFFLIVVHPAPPQPATCKVLALPDATTEFFVSSVNSSPIEQSGVGIWNIAQYTDPTPCISAARGVLTQGISNDGTTLDPFRVIGVEKFNESNNPACTKVKRR